MPRRQSRSRAEITGCAGNLVVLEISGELDPSAMPEFEVARAALISSQPNEIVFDVSRAEFICGAGYAAIGRCRLGRGCSVHSDMGRSAITATEGALQNYRLLSSMHFRRVDQFETVWD